MREQIQAIHQLLTQGKIDEAESIAHALTHQHPAAHEPLVALAHIYFTVGRLQDAQDFALQALDMAPDEHELHHVLGKIQLGLGQSGSAINSFQIAVRLMPQHGESFFQLARIYQQLGESQQAEYYLHEARKVDPAHVQVNVRLAQIAMQRSAFKKAIEYLQAATDGQCHDATLFHLIGDCYQQMGQLHDSLKYYEAALKIQPNLLPTLNNAGLALYAIGQFESAAKLFKGALTHDPKFIDAATNLSRCLRELNQSQEAANICEHVMALGRVDAKLCNVYGCALLDLDRLDAANSAYEKAIELAPDFALPHANLAGVKKELNDFERAQAEYETAISLDGANADIRSNYALFLADAGNLAGAQTEIEAARKLRAHDPEIEWNASLIYLKSGDYEKGWPLYESRWHSKRALKGAGIDFGKPQWLGEDLNGKVLFVHPEQGLGDSLQFIRYIKNVTQLFDVKIILTIQKPLFSLFETLSDVDVLLRTGEPIPAFDYHCSMMSLPLAMGTSLATIPAQTPYLDVSESLVDDWKLRLCGLKGKKVGLVWAGSGDRASVVCRRLDRRRSMALSSLQPILDVPDVSFVSLQMGSPAAELEAMQVENVLDLQTEIRDFRDTAAIMRGLDLVISVDTSCVHMAGALNVPVWMLSRYDGCWRWLHGRDDSPWYPSLKIFSQDKPGDWTHAVQRISDLLRE